MKKLLPLFTFLAAASLFACTGQDTGSEPSKPELKIGKIDLAFEASGNASQTVDVTANVEWNVSVASTASEWLHATKTDNKTITVSVSDNTGEQRVGLLTVSAEGGNVTPKKITVTQAKAEAKEYTLSVEPTAMTFIGLEAQPQMATVTVSDPQLGWSAAPEEEIKDWVTVKAEGDKLTVSVSDNPDTTPRAGNVIITPDKDSAPKKAVRITQEGRPIVPSLEVSPKELMFEAIRGLSQNVTVTAVGGDWTAAVLREDEIDVSWIELSLVKNDEHSFFSVNVVTNPTLEERRGYIVVKSTNPEVEDITVAVIQEAGVEHISNLTQNAVLDNMAEGLSNDVFFSPNQEWNDRDYAVWDIDLWSVGVTRKKDWYGFWLYSGAGTRLFLKIRSERIVHNYDEVYVLPEGEYPVSGQEEYLPGTVAPGARTADFATPDGSWYLEVAGEDNTYGDKAPISGGKVTVSLNGDEYTLDLELTDDAGFTITGRCVTKLDNMRVNFFPKDDPSLTPEPNPDPDEPTDPEGPTDPDEPTPY